MLNPSTDRHQDKAHAALLQRIKQEADRDGIMSFARFMELALYTPGLGYYERSQNVVGRSGDFFTSVSVGRLFGELLACQFVDWLEKTPVEQPVIVECGAHNGQLAADILHHLKSEHSSLFGRIEYRIIENSPKRTSWQKEKLKPFGEQIRWCHSWTDLSSFRDNERRRVDGVIFSNELLDALPFHRLVWRKELAEWRELGVRADGERFQLEETSISSELLEVIRAPSEYPSFIWPNVPEPLLDVLPDKFQIEVSPALAQWWKEAAEALHRGWLLASDYGQTASEFFVPQRVNGTARGYRTHKPVDDLLANPGEQDITASVNFSVLEWVGEQCGLDSWPLESQSQFLTRILAKLSAQHMRELDAKQIREFQTLTHPDHLGRAFRVFTQTRGISEAS